MFDDIYQGSTAFITGHTGFKGSWLRLWLEHLGARPIGYSVDVPTDPSHHRLLFPDEPFTPSDVRDIGRLTDELTASRADIVFHLAAQPLVRKSYQEPLDTFSTNVMGAAAVLEACRRAPTVRACLIVTSDKCYENREWDWGYRETDALGGRDPYSASKGCAEIVTWSYARSFLLDGQDGRTVAVASARAGNVIGGGDWGLDRLTPDVMKAAARNEPTLIRNPHAVRPWQHVLDVLSGYLLLGQKLLEGRMEFCQPWNFSPPAEACRTVAEVVGEYGNYWPEVEYRVETRDDQPHEAGLLMLDSSKARHRLGWRPVWNGERSFAETARWYRDYYNTGRVISWGQLAAYEEDARRADES